MNARSKWTAMLIAGVAVACRDPAQNPAPEQPSDASSRQVDASLEPGRFAEGTAGAAPEEGDHPSAECVEALAQPPSHFLQRATDEASTDEASELWARCSLEATYARLASHPPSLALLRRLEAFLVKTDRQTIAANSLREGGGTMYLHAHLRARLPVALTLSKLGELELGPRGQESSPVVAERVRETASALDQTLAPSSWKAPRGRRELPSVVAEKRREVEALLGALGGRSDRFAAAVVAAVDESVREWMTAQGLEALRDEPELEAHPERAPGAP